LPGRQLLMTRIVAIAFVAYVLGNMLAGFLAALR
jgi:hypothetical protein